MHLYRSLVLGLFLHSAADNDGCTPGCRRYQAAAAVRRKRVPVKAWLSATGPPWTLDLRVPVRIRAVQQSATHGDADGSVDVIRGGCEARREEGAGRRHSSAGAPGEKRTGMPAHPR